MRRCPASKFIERPCGTVAQSPGNKASFSSLGLLCLLRSTTASKIVQNVQHIESGLCVLSDQSSLSMASADELKALGNKAIAAKDFDEAM
jgi:hypothetical protein